MKCNCGYNLSSDNITINLSVLSDLFDVDNNGMIHLNSVMKCPNCQLQYSGIIEMSYEKNKECLKRYVYDKFGLKISDKQLDEVIVKANNKIQNSNDINNYNSIWDFTIYELEECERWVRDSYC